MKPSVFGKTLSIIGLVCGLIAIVFMAGQAFNGANVSVFYLTFVSSSANKKESIDAFLVIGFCLYAIVFLLCMAETYMFARNKSSNLRFLIALVEVVVIIFYIVYLVKLASKDYTVTALSLGDGSIGFLVCLGISSVLNFVSPFVELY